MIAAAAEEVRNAVGAAQAGFGVSASQQLGITFAQNRYDKRVQALTEPGEYAKERKAAYVKLTRAVDESYDARFTSMLGQVWLPMSPVNSRCRQLTTNAKFSNRF